jgi:DNA polymerase III subunit epsilon
MNLPEAACLVEASPDFRLLRRVPTPRDWPFKAASGETRRGVFVDTETTGLDQDTDEVIELALLPFEYERDTGAIVRVDQDAALSAFRQPSFSIPPESAKIHGLTDEMVSGQVIDPERIKALIEPAHIVIAHNAAFDRPMVESTGRSSKRSTGPVRSPRSTGRAKALGLANSTISCGPGVGFTTGTAPSPMPKPRCFS